MESLGFFGILKVAAQILGNNFKHFLYLSVLGQIIPYAIVVAISPVFDAKQSAKTMLALLSGSTESGVDDEPPHPLPPAPTASFALILFITILYVSFVYMPMLITSLCRGYLHKPLHFKTSLIFVPSSFMPILLTVLCLFGAFMAILVAATIVVLLLAVIFSFAKLSPGIPISIVAFVSVVGILYLCFVWYLASTVTVLEQKGGWDALRRSAFLLKGHKGDTLGLIFLFLVCRMLINSSITTKGSFAFSLSMAVLSIFLSALISLYSAATIVVLYISCKLYHNEPVESLPAARHLGGDDTLTKYMDLESVEHSTLSTNMVI